MREGWALYAAGALVCAAIALTTGTSDDSLAWHTGSIIVIVGILALWRLSRP
jgi:hypothetical protein